VAIFPLCRSDVTQHRSPCAKIKVWQGCLFMGSWQRPGSWSSQLLEDTSIAAPGLVSMFKASIFTSPSLAFPTFMSPPALVLLPLPSLTRTLGIASRAHLGNPGQCPHLKVPLEATLLQFQGSGHGHWPSRACHLPTMTALSDWSLLIPSRCPSQEVLCPRQNG
jgi:hypothetical protein